MSVCTWRVCLWVVCTSRSKTEAFCHGVACSLALSRGHAHVFEHIHMYSSSDVHLQYFYYINMYTYTQIVHMHILKAVFVHVYRRHACQQAFRACGVHRGHQVAAGRDRQRQVKMAVSQCGIRNRLDAQTKPACIHVQAHTCTSSDRAWKMSG